jgi:hypothetical protein
MKWRYGIVKIYHGPEKIPELALCEVYFKEDPNSVVAFSESGTTFVSDEDAQDQIILQLENALKDCRKFPVFDSLTLVKQDL